MTFYIDSADKYAAEKLQSTLKTMIYEKTGAYTHIVILCIGTDRVTGDSLGPFVGDKLKNTLPRVYGTIHNPIHAKNLAPALKSIHCSGSPLVIAIDAALGSRIGCITINDTGLQPGTALCKSLPRAGSIGITGIVNSQGFEGIKILQNTRLSTVLDISEVIAAGVLNAVKDIEGSFPGPSRI